MVSRFPSVTHMARSSLLLVRASVCRHYTYPNSLLISLVVTFCLFLSILHVPSLHHRLYTRFICSFFSLSRSVR